MAERRQIRNPKAEGRKKSEGRNRNCAKPVWLGGLGFWGLGHLDSFRVSSFGFRVYRTAGLPAACCHGAATVVLRLHDGVVPMRVAKSPLFAGLPQQFLHSAFCLLPSLRIGCEPTTAARSADPIGQVGGGSAAWPRRRCRHPAVPRSGPHYTPARRRSDGPASAVGWERAGRAA